MEDHVVDSKNMKDKLINFQILTSCINHKKQAGSFKDTRKVSLRSGSFSTATQMKTTELLNIQNHIEFITSFFS